MKADEKGYKRIVIDEYKADVNKVVKRVLEIIDECTIPSNLKEKYLMISANVLKHKIKEEFK